MSRSLPWNPIPNAVNITVERPRNANDEELFLVAELRCGTHVISDDDGYSYEFGLNKIFVEIQLENCKLKPGRRVGDVDRHYVVKKRQRTSKSHTRGSKLTGEAGTALALQSSIAGAAPSANVRVAANSSKEVERHNFDGMEETIETIFHPVVSNGANELIVQAPSGQVLRGAFLSHEDLCTIIPDPNSLYSLRVEASFQPLSVEITSCASERKHWLKSDISKNKLAFVKLLVAKHLSEGNQTPVVNSLSRAVAAADGYNGPPTPTDSKQ